MRENFSQLAGVWFGAGDLDPWAWSWPFRATAQARGGG
jgi:hypothetical protein